MRNILLDSLTGSALALRAVLWVLLVLLFVCLGVAGPKSLHRNRYKEGNETHGVWSKELISVTPMHQFLLLEAQIKLAKTHGFSELDLNVTINLLGGDDVPLLVDQTHTREFILDIHKRNEGYSEPVRLIHLADLKYSSYNFTIDFNKDDNKDWIQDVAFVVTVVNPRYTEFTIVLKWLYILVTVEVWFLFRRRLSVIPEKKLAAQRWLSMLLVALIFFNDPLCVSYTLAMKTTWIVSLVSVLMQLSFAFLLLLFWLLVVDALYEQTGDLNEFDESEFQGWWKYGLVFVGWVTTAFLLTWLRVNQVNDPTLTYVSDFEYFPILQDTCVAITGIYFFWLAHIVVKAQGNMEAGPMQRRFYFTLLFSLVLLVSFVLGTIIGVFPYIGEGQLVNTKGWHFTAVFALVNGYVYAMAYMFLPSGSQGDDVFEALYKEEYTEGL